MRISAKVTLMLSWGGIAQQGIVIFAHAVIKEFRAVVTVWCDGWLISRLIPLVFPERRALCWRAVLSISKVGRVRLGRIWIVVVLVHSGMISSVRKGRALFTRMRTGRCGRCHGSRRSAGKSSAFAVGIGSAFTL